MRGVKILFCQIEYIEIMYIINSTRLLNHADSCLSLFRNIFDHNMCLADLHKVAL